MPDRIAPDQDLWKKLDAVFHSCKTVSQLNTAWRYCILVINKQLDAQLIEPNKKKWRSCWRHSYRNEYSIRLNLIKGDA